MPPTITLASGHPLAGQARAQLIGTSEEGTHSMVRGAGSQGWAQVDQAGDPQQFIQGLVARSNSENYVARGRFIAESLHVQEGQHLLEVGCGIGDAARELAALVGNSAQS